MYVFTKKKRKNDVENLLGTKSLIRKKRVLLQLVKIPLLIKKNFLKKRALFLQNLKNDEDIYDDDDNCLFFQFPLHSKINEITKRNLKFFNYLYFFYWFFFKKYYGKIFLLYHILLKNWYKKFCPSFFFKRKKRIFYKFFLIKKKMVLSYNGLQKINNYNNNMSLILKVFKKLSVRGERIKKKLMYFFLYRLQMFTKKIFFRFRRKMFFEFFLDKKQQQQTLDYILAYRNKYKKYYVLVIKNYLVLLFRLFHFLKKKKIFLKKIFKYFSTFFLFVLTKNYFFKIDFYYNIWYFIKFFNGVKKLEQRSRFFKQYNLYVFRQLYKRTNTILFLDVFNKQTFFYKFVKFFQKCGNFGKSQNLYISLIFYWKIKYGFSFYYILYLVQTIYKIPFFLKKKKKSGRVLYYPSNIPIHLFWLKFFLLLKKVLIKKVNIHYIDSYISEIEALFFQQKQSLLRNDLENLVDLALTSRVNITKRYKETVFRKKKYFTSKKVRKVLGKWKFLAKLKVWRKKSNIYKKFYKKIPS